MAAVLLLLVGSLILFCVATEKGDDFMNEKYETNHYTIQEGYRDISVITQTAEVAFVISDDGTTNVTCFEESKMKHTVEVKDGKLVITVVDTRKWYDHISFGSFKTPKITVSLPEGEYGELLIESSTGDVRTHEKLLFDRIGIQLTTGDIHCLSSSRDKMNLKTSTGDITVKAISTGKLGLSVTTGKVTVTGTTVSQDIFLSVSTGKANLSDVSCEKLESKGSTGSLSLKNVIATKSFTIRRTTGNVRFDRCDAAEITVRVDTGDVTGTLLSDKTFLASSDTGKVNVPQNTVGGTCKITASTGNIEIKTAN